MKDTVRARKGREYFERRLFSPSCALFSRVYCVPYYRSYADDLEYISTMTDEDIDNSCKEWIYANSGEYSMCKNESRSLTFFRNEKHNLSAFCCRVINLKKLRLLRNTLREFDETNIVFITQKRYADCLAHAFGPYAKAVYDFKTSCRIPVKEYNIRGYRQDGTDIYKAASDRRWKSPDRPYALKSTGIGIPSDAHREIAVLAEKCGCSVHRFLGQIVCEILDSELWKNMAGSSGRKISYGKELLRQDVKNGVEPSQTERLKALIAPLHSAFEIGSEGET